MLRTARLALAVAAAQIAMAAVPNLSHSVGVPDPAQSTTDGDLMLGNARGLGVLPSPNVRPTVTDGYRVVVRDVLNNPLPGTPVTLRFAGTGVRPHATQTNGQVASCLLAEITKPTNPLGEVIFFPATVGMNASPVPNVEIRAAGVLLAMIRFRSIDLVPTNGGGPSLVDGFDINEFRLRIFNLDGQSEFDPETDFATEGPSAGRTDGFDANVLRTEVLCGITGAPIPLPCSQSQCP